MDDVRSEAVAGLFYPAGRSELARVVDSHLAAATASRRQGRVAGVIAPHAGYAYSGAVAGSAFRALRQGAGAAPTVVVMGPSHRVAFEGVATSPSDRFRTPLAEVEVDRETTASLERLAGVFASSEVHADEHAIEVELPFLQRAFADLRIVPLVVGRAAPEMVARVMAAALTGPDRILVVSSDLSHYLTDAEARRIDEETAQRIEALASDLEPAAACGAAVINGLCVLARAQGWTVSRLDLRNSADATADRRRVVGYGAFAFGPESAEPASSDEAGCRAAG